MPYLTDPLVAGLKPAGRDQFVWDSEISGFGVKVATTGRKTFVLQWRADPGRPESRRRKIAAVGEITVAEARKLAQTLKSHLTQAPEAGATRPKAEPKRRRRAAEPADAPGSIRTRDALAWLRGDAHIRPDGVRYHYSPTKAKIVESACEAFLQQGYDVSLDVIAEGAGCSTPTIYKYFKNKEELFKAAVAEYGLRQLPQVDLAADLPLREVFAFIGRTYRAYLLTDRSLAIHRLAITDIRQFPEISDRLFNLTMRIFDILVERIAQAVAAGQIKRVDPVLTAEGFLAAAVGFDRTRLLVGLPLAEPDIEERRLAAMLDVFMDGLRPA